MKILFVTDSLSSGGAERVMTILANEFVSEGYHISIFSKSVVTPFYNLNSGVKVVFPKYKINYKNQLTTLYGRLRVYSDIFYYLKNNKFNLVIPFSTTTNGVIIPICKVLGIPVIASEHTNFKANRSISERFIKQFIYPLADKLTVLTTRDKNEFYGKYLKNVVVMPNPLPLDPVNNYTEEKRERTILAVGSVGRWRIKGFDNLIKIYAEIIKEFPDWKLQIAGGGDKGYLVNLINELKLNNHIELLGQVSNMEQLMRESSIFTLTSRWEGLPMGLLEAMSQGMACIAFDCYSGPGDLITNNFDGILIKDQNNKEFIKELSLLIGDIKKRQIIGENAIETSKKYLPKIILGKWKVLINKIILS